MESLLVCVDVPGDDVNVRWVNVFAVIGTTTHANRREVQRWGRGRGGGGVHADDNAT